MTTTTTPANPKPRGGRRPGAGAPRNNFNGLRTGNHTERLLMVYFMMRDYPHKWALAHELLHAGFIQGRKRRFNGDLRGLVQYLYHRWFENPEELPLSAKCNRTHRRRKSRAADTKQPQDQPK